MTMMISCQLVEAHVRAGIELIELYEICKTVFVPFTALLSPVLPAYVMFVEVY